MFHWNDQRIKGHVALCFLAYTMMNTITKSLKWSEKKLSRALDKMQFSKVQQTPKGKPFFLRSALDLDTQEMIKKLKLVVPKDSTPENLINQYFKE